MSYLSIINCIYAGERPKGKLYAEMPPGGIPLADGTWVPKGSLIRPNAAV